MNPKKIILCGWKGYIGYALTQRLINSGYSIIGIDNNLREKSVNRQNSISATTIDTISLETHPNFNNCTLDISKDYEDLKSVFRDFIPDVVINLAGENIAGGFWTKTQKNKLMNSRIMSVRRIVQAMGAMNERPKVFLSASAIGFYGNRGDEELNETSSEGAGFLSQICQSWENEITKSNDLGIRTVICRLGMVLGHDGGALEKIIPAFKLGVGGKLGDGSQWMSWIHINDLSNMLIHAIDESSVNGIYNAVSPNPVINREFTKILGKVLKRPTIFPVPHFLLKIALGELSDLLLGSQMVIAQKIIDTGFEFQYPQLEEALREVCGHSHHENNIEQWVPQSSEKTW